MSKQDQPTPALGGETQDRMGHALLTLAKHVWTLHDRQRVLEAHLAAAGIEIDITHFCKEAAQYRVEFQKTGGRDDLEIRSMVALFDGQRVEEYVQRDAGGNTFHVNVPGLGIPLKLEAVVRSEAGPDSHGQVSVSQEK